MYKRQPNCDSKIIGDQRALREKLRRLSAKLVTAKFRPDQNIENVPVGIGADELDAIRSGIALAHMLFERDLISDNLDDAVRCV